MADEKHSRDEQAKLFKSQESDWLDNDNQFEDHEADTTGKKIDMDAMIDEILNHIDPNDWEEWKEETVKRAPPQPETPSAGTAPEQPHPNDPAPASKREK